MAMSLILPPAFHKAAQRLAQDRIRLGPWQSIATALTAIRKT
jgi:hypothetical protein